MPILACSFTTSVVVVALFMIWTLQHDRVPHDVPLTEAHLSAELNKKVERCHQKGMKAGRLHNGCEVVDIKCYEQ